MRSDFNPPLDVLLKLENMSVRSVNTCRRGDLYYLSEIIQYITTHSNFLKIRNCGVKTNEDLLKIYSKYCDIYANSNIPLPVVKSISIDPEDNISLEELNEIEQMSARAYHVCKNHDLNDIQSLIQYYNSHKIYGFGLLRNCGGLTNGELISICKKYEELFLNNEERKRITNANYEL